MGRHPGALRGALARKKAEDAAGAFWSGVSIDLSNYASFVENNVMDGGSSPPRPTTQVEFTRVVAGAWSTGYGLRDSTRSSCMLRQASED